MIQQFDYYLKQGLVKRESPNTELSNALLRKAERRFKQIRVQRISNENADFIFEDAYESAREAAQALMAVKGYKPISHEAVIAFLEEFYKDNFSNYELAMLDRYRKLRNLSVYEARPVTKIDAELALSTATEMLNKIKKILII